MAPRVRAEAAVIVDLARRAARRRPRQRVAAFAARDQSLNDAWLDGPAGREALVVGQAHRRQSKSFVADDGRNRYLDPLVTRPLVTAALFAVDRPPRQAEGPRHLLPPSDLRLVEASRAFVRRVAQDRPHDRSLPAGHPAPRGRPHLAQQPGDRSDAQTFHRVHVVHQPHDLRFDGVDLVASRRIAGLANVAIAIRGAAQNRDLPGLGAMAFAAAGPFEDLRTLIFGDHALELQHQLIFRRAGMRRLEENRLDAVAGELLGQQDLVSVFAAQPVRRVDQDSLNVALGGKIAQPLQTRPQQAGATESLVLDDPLIRYAVSLFPRELDERRGLAGNRVLLLLLLGGDSRVDRGGLHRSCPSRADRRRRRGLVPGPGFRRPARV